MALPFSLSQLIPLAIYCFLASVLGILGNTTVLYASLRYNAMELDEVSLVFVQVRSSAKLYT